MNLINDYLSTFNHDDLDSDFEAVSNESLHDLLQSISEAPHIAGNFQDIFLADWIKQKFLDFGLDHAEVWFQNSYLCNNYNLLLLNLKFLHKGQKLPGIARLSK